MLKVIKAKTSVGLFLTLSSHLDGTELGVVRNRELELGGSHSTKQVAGTRQKAFTLTMALLESSKTMPSSYLSASGLDFVPQGIKEQGKKYAVH